MLMWSTRIVASGDISVGTAAYWGLTIFSDRFRELVVSTSLDRPGQASVVTLPKARANDELGSLGVIHFEPEYPEMIVRGTIAMVLFDQSFVLMSQREAAFTNRRRSLVAFGGPSKTSTPSA